MTVLSSVNRIEYTGNGVLDVYAYTFRIIDETLLKVYVNGVLLALTTDYTVSGVGEATGGNVTFVVTPPNTEPIIIMRRVPFTQLIDYIAHDSFPAETHEQALDLLTMMVPPYLDGNLIWDPGNLVDGAGETSATITVTGAELGDYVMVSAPYDLQELTATAYVTATDTVEIRLQNETGGPINLASGTWNIRVIKKKKEEGVMATVETAVKKINEASEALGELIRANEAKAKELEELQGVVSKEVEKIGQNKVELDKREKAIKSIEDVAKVKKDAENLLKSVEHARTDIAKRQKKLDGDMERQRKENDEILKTVEHDKIMNKKEADALIQTRKELKKREERLAS